MFANILTVLSLLVVAWAYIADNAQSATLVALLCVLIQIVALKHTIEKRVER